MTPMFLSAAAAVETDGTKQERLTTSTLPSTFADAGKRAAQSPPASTRACSVVASNSTCSRRLGHHRLTLLRSVVSQGRHDSLCIISLCDDACNGRRAIARTPPAAAAVSSLHQQARPSLVGVLRHARPVLPPPGRGRTRQERPSRGGDVLQGDFALAFPGDVVRDEGIYLERGTEVVRGEFFMGEGGREVARNRRVVGEGVRGKVISGEVVLGEGGREVARNNGVRGECVRGGGVRGEVFPGEGGGRSPGTRLSGASASEARSSWARGGGRSSGARSREVVQSEVGLCPQTHIITYLMLN